MSDIKNDIYIDAVAAYSKHRSYNAAGRELNIDPRTVKRRVEHFYRTPHYSNMAKQATEAGIDPDRVSHFWYKTRNPDGADVSLFVKNHVEFTFEEMSAELADRLRDYSPKYEHIERKPFNLEGNLAVVDPADVHIGKLAVIDETGDASYDIAEACKRVREGVETLVGRFDAHNVTNIAFIIGNDILHIDNQRRTTTGGTPQDTDGQWWQMFLAAKSLYVDIIEYLATEYNVFVVYVPSNHDNHVGFMLADTILSWFREHPNVSFGTRANELVSPKNRKYIRYGDNLIGFTHGDGAKEKDLPGLMQVEARTEWGQTKHAYWYVHHFHHKIRNAYSEHGLTKIEKDLTGITINSNSEIIDAANQVNVEYVRSPSPADAWHAKKGYMSRQAIECFIHNHTHGQIARLTHYF